MDIIDDQQLDLCEGNDTSESMAMARQERARQGPWEAEFSFGGEVDLHRHLDTCDKNPGHVNFIPVDQFKMEHLPVGYHDNELLDLIRAVSDLTVRVSAKYVSHKRPEVFPGSDKPYPCQQNKGETMMRVGTGFVNDISFGDKTCNCMECLKSTAPKTQFAYIFIRTATHVVFDGSEGEHTNCHLFYDKGFTPTARNGVITLSGMCKVQNFVSNDFCAMQYITHDMDLVNKLQVMRNRYQKILRTLGQKYFTLLSSIGYSPLEGESSPSAESVFNTRLPLTFIVSHPHGCSKQVSVGVTAAKYELPNRLGKYTYTTATCPGSSGAYVGVIWNNWVMPQECEFGHCGNCDENKDLNYCTPVGF